MVIGEILKVGDTVVVNIPKENWDWGYRPVDKQFGTKGKVLGFSEIHYSRVCNYGHGPGVYVNYCWVTVQVEGKKPFSISDCHIDLEDKNLEKSRTVAWREAGGPSQKTRLRDLPEMKLWEHDLVKFVGPRSPWPDVELFKIVNIHYEYIGQKRTDGVTPMPEYDISPLNGGGHTAVNESDLLLVSRGNVWKYYHGEKPVFADLKEEAALAEMLGKTKELRNPKSQLYSWTLDEALEAIRNGTADGITVSNGLFGGGARTNVMWFEDRELGRRVAAATLEGFKDHVPEKM